MIRSESATFTPSTVMKGTFPRGALPTPCSATGSKGRRQRRDPARDVGIENAEAVQSHDSRRSKMDLIVRVHIDGDLLHHGRPSSRFTLTAVSRPDRRQRLHPSFLVHVGYRALSRR